MNREQQIGKLAVQSNRIFLDSARELMTSFDAAAVEQAMTSWIRLHYSEHAGDSEPSLESFLKLQEMAFLNLLDKGAIEPVAPITKLGDKALDGLRRHCGVGVEALPPPAPVMTPEQKLEAEVTSDWKTLTSAQIRQKMNKSKVYRAMFEKLSETDAIGSQVTLHSVIEGVGA